MWIEEFKKFSFEKETNHDTNIRKTESGRIHRHGSNKFYNTSSYWEEEKKKIHFYDSIK